LSQSTPRMTRPAGAGLDPKLQSIYENLEILNGARGDGMDRSILMRDLVDLGIITAKKGAGGQVVPSLPNTGGGSTLPGGEVIEAPTIPLNVIATGGFSSILIEWDTPTYGGHAYAEILRANVDDFSLAVKIATTAANLYSDAVGGGREFYYWVRFVNKSDIKGPIQSTFGVLGKTEADIGDILDKLKGEIDESFLTPDFNDRINDYGEGISENDKGIITLNGEVIDVQSKTELLSISAEITAEGLAEVAAGRDDEGYARRAIVASIQKDQQVLFTSTGAMAQEISEVSVRVDDNKASIIDTKTSVIALDQKTGEAISAVTQRIETQDSTIGDISSRVTTNTTTIATVNAKTDANGNEISRVETSISARLDVMSSSIGSNTSRITTQEQTLVEVGSDVNSNKQSISSISQRLVTLESTSGSLTSKVTQNTQTIATINADGSNAYKAQWGVKASIGDIQAGIGLTVKRETGKPDVSQCTIIAGQFSVGVAATAGSTTVYPFIVAPHPDTGVPSVFIDTAYIKAARIQDLVAGEVIADNIKAAATLTAPDIKGGKIAIGSKFSVDENGNMISNDAIIANAYVQGNLNASSGTFRNVLIDETCDVRGTIYANKIVGDIYRAISISVPKKNDIFSRTVVANGSFETQNYARRLQFPSLSLYGYGVATAYYYVNGVIVASQSFTISDNIVGTATSNAYPRAGVNSPPYVYTMPANVSGTFEIRLEINSQIGGNVERISEVYSQVVVFGLFKV